MDRRRAIRFETIPEAIAEAERLALSDRQGKVVRKGNWGVGQALGHCATWADFGFDGYPPNVQAPWLVRSMLQIMKGWILSRGMMAGVKIRGIPDGTLGIEPLKPEVGLERFRTAYERLSDRCPTWTNPVFGPLTHAEWIQLNLRHAELHLSFLDVM